MSKVDTYTYCEKHLFSTDIEMKKAELPQLIISRIVRIRDVYNQLLRNPRSSTNTYIDYICRTYQVSKSSAYEDINIVKNLLGNINQASKDFHRFQANEMLMRTFQIAENRKDARGMAAAVSAYIKANNLDKVDDQNFLWDESQNQPFKFTDDPTVLGITRIPNVKNIIINLKKKHGIDDNAEDIVFEEVDKL